MYIHVLVNFIYYNFSLGILSMHTGLYQKAWCMNMSNDSQSRLEFQVNWVLVILPGPHSYPNWNSDWKPHLLLIGLYVTEPALLFM